MPLHLLPIRSSAVALLIASSSAALAQPSTERDTMPVIRLREGTSAFTAYSGIEDSVRAVIRDPAEWQALWSRINRAFVPQPALPAIDFKREMIVVAALGRRPNAGYDVVVERVEHDSTGLEVEVRRISPAPGCPVAAVVTHPLDLARVPASDQPVRFRERNVVVPCGTP